MASYPKNYRINEPGDSVEDKAARPTTAVNGIHLGDNLAFMASMDDAWLDLIYVDPPFCTGKKQQCEGQRFADSWQGGMAEYLAFLEPRLRHMHRLLRSTGTLYVHLDWHAVHYVKVMLDTIFGSEHFLNEIIWSYRTGGLSTKWFGRKHDTILAYAKRMGQHKFHVQRGGEFRTDGMNYDEQGRPYKNTRTGRLYFNANGPALTDVWEIPFLSTVSSERVGYPTQKPVALLERVICSSSDSGDLVADFFCGSGTALVAARQLGRRCIGCDCSESAVAIARRRLAELDEPADKPRVSAP